MKPTTIFTKLKILFNVFVTSPMVLILTALIVGLIITLFIKYKNKDENVKKIFLYGYILILVCFIGVYYKYILDALNIMITTILTEYYFPSIATYMLIMVVLNVVVPVSVFYNKVNSVVRKINLVIFGILNALFLSFLFIVDKYNLPFDNLIKLHSNEKALAITQLSTIVALIWSFVFIGYYFYRKLAHVNPELVLEPEKEIVKVEKIVEKVVKVKVFEEEEITQLIKSYDEENMLLKEELKLLRLLQEEHLKNLTTEIKKVMYFGHHIEYLDQQTKALQIIAHNNNVEIQDEIDLIEQSQKQENRKVKKQLRMIKKRLNESEEENN